MFVNNLLTNVAILTVLAPLTGALIAGLAGRKISRGFAHSVTILGIAIAVACSAYLVKALIVDGVPSINVNLYTWGASGSFTFNVGFLIDRLSALMLLTVSSVSLIVHIYSVGYMQGDGGYQRFFSYMSLFTFFMLTLTLANNFLLLFFGWEGVGLVSYLLIGFWFHKESAAQGSLKAFLVNRMGDFGFILGIAAILEYFNSLDYATVFANGYHVANATISLFPGTHSSVITVICLLLFIGAMAKSAQIPLHVWLPESMEGPTPISALIHAATMVTAGVYMVARMSPLYELSTVALSVVLIIGATGALFMGLLGLVENDIKRVIAYSTMSQLGYMMAANGASAFTASIFHLVTHAGFKALLFLAAGSVIIGLHHEQNLWKMGNLKKYMPLTYIAFLVGALALSALPPFAGYYSKDAIINAVHAATIPGAQYAYICLLIGAFVTPLYIFRAFFLAFHGKERFDAKLKKELRESPWVITVPLILLVIPSIGIGALLVGPMFSTVHPLLGNSVYVKPTYFALTQLSAQFHSVLAITLESVKSLPCWFALAGIITAWLTYVMFPGWPAVLRKRLAWVYHILAYKYGFDAFNNLVFVRGVRRLSNFFYYFADLKVLDGWIVNGSGRGINRVSMWLRRLQSGYLYHYALAMIVGLLFLLSWMLVK
jgi:NADH-quinone oxidoreductase subunit L